MVADEESKKVGDHQHREKRVLEVVYPYRFVIPLNYVTFELYLKFIAFLSQFTTWV